MQLGAQEAGLEARYLEHAEAAKCVDELFPPPGPERERENTANQDSSTSDVQVAETQLAAAKRRTVDCHM